MSDSSISLIVLQHGLWGKGEHMDALYKELEATHSDTASILNIRVNESKYTYDGIDICGERLAEKICMHVKELQFNKKKVTRFSIIGYSLGGLIARYALGILHENGFFNTIEPQAFITFATPHMGVRSPSSSIQASVFNFLCSHMVSHSGEQLQLQDNFHQGRPLIEVISDPEERYFKALELFKLKRVYANIANDRTVPYWTAGIEVTDYFNRLDTVSITRDEHYCSLVSAYDVYDPLLNSQDKSKLLPKILFYTAVIILWPLFGVFAFSYIGAQGVASRHRVSRAIYNKKCLSDPSCASIETPDRGQMSLIDNGVLDIVQETYPDNSHVHNPSNDKPLKSKVDPSVHKRICNIPPTPALHAISRPLKLTQSQLNVHENLNKLKWERIFVYIDGFNAHASIVCRQKRFDGVQGRAVIQHFIDTFKP
ncbi:putative serine esterase-domain-containing protein [Spinellus fusiger]|nr:putative serine esterase-domain-containing protein [Spinellus fusiger]